MRAPEPSAGTSSTTGAAYRAALITAAASAPGRTRHGRPHGRTTPVPESVVATRPAARVGGAARREAPAAVTTAAPAARAAISAASSRATVVVPDRGAAA